MCTRERQVCLSSRRPGVATRPEVNQLLKHTCTRTHAPVLFHAHATLFSLFHSATTRAWISRSSASRKARYGGGRDRRRLGRRPLTLATGASPGGDTGTAAAEAAAATAAAAAAGGEEEEGVEEEGRREGVRLAAAAAATAATATATSTATAAEAAAAVASDAAKKVVPAATAERVVAGEGVAAGKLTP